MGPGLDQGPEQLDRLRCGGDRVRLPPGLAIDPREPGQVGCQVEPIGFPARMAGEERSPHCQARLSVAPARFDSAETGQGHRSVPVC